MPGHGFPETMYAFRLSGEKEAAALLAEHVVLEGSHRSKRVMARELPEQPLQIRICCGESTVSEKIKVVPSGEAARTLPDTPAIAEAEPAVVNNIALLVPNAVLSTPKYSLVPVLSKSAELGGNGSGIGIPATNGVVALERVIGTTWVLQVVATARHPIEVTNTFGLEVALAVPGA